MVCLSSVPGQAALSIDKQLDDGLPEGGSLRATLSTDGTALTPPPVLLTATVSPAALTAYVGEKFYTICRNL